MKIGTVIRRHRRLAKMTLEALAARADTDAAALSRVERGLQGYTPEGLAKLAEALGTTSAALMTEAENDQEGVDGKPIPPLSDEQELLHDYRRLKSPARSIARLMIAELAKLSNGSNAHA